MNRITNQIKLIGGMLSFLIVSVVFITVYINQSSQRDSVVINIAGKQRMLTQKIGKEVLWVARNDSLDFRELDAATLEFETTLGDLIRGNEQRNIYAPPRPCIGERLVQVETLWKGFLGNLQLFKALIGDVKRLKSDLPEQNRRLLELSDGVVKQMVARGLGGKEIDDAGRQRMLTQKMALHSTQYLITGDARHFSDFFDSFGLYETTLQGFVNSPELASDRELQALLAENREAWKQYALHVMQLMQKQKEINDIMNAIAKSNLSLLEMMDSAVAAYTGYSEEQRSFLQYFQYAASFFALMAMLYSARLTWQIEQHFSDFLKRSEAMASSVGDARPVAAHGAQHGDELTLASMHMSHFVTKINTVLEHAQQAIRESEQAARELADMTDTMDDELDALNLDEASKKDIDRTMDRSEDIVIQTLEELTGTSKLLQQLQQNLNTIISKTDRQQ